MDSLLLQSLIVTHKDRFLKDKNLIDRDLLVNIDPFLKSREVIFLSGIRRSGKSSLMSLIARQILGSGLTHKENILFINFEDERFINFTVDDFDRLYQSYIQIDNPGGMKYLFFDEIQNIPFWERWINRLYEFEEVKIFITGSNASLLASSVSFSLTGRNRQLGVHPFSFVEFLRFQGINIGAREMLLGENISAIKRAFDLYLSLGGFPEIIKNQDVMLADQYFKDIIHRDVISRYNIRNVKEIRELCLYLISNSGTLLSYEALRKTMNAKNATTVKNYLNILQDVYMIRALSIYDFSVKKQIFNPDKYYITDLGFYHAVGFKFSQNLGKLLENIVFEQLDREYADLYYWKSARGKEVDFLVRQQSGISHAFQVTYALTAENRERELAGLEAVVTELGKPARMILTWDQEELITTDSGEIQVLPVWKWLTKGVTRDRKS